MFYTGGTTNDPKGYLRSNRPLLNHSYDVGSHLGVTAEEVGLGVVPFCDVWGYDTFTSTLTHGASLVIRTRFDPARTLELTGDHEVTYVSAPATMLLRPKDHEAFVPAGWPRSHSTRPSRSSRHAQAVRTGHRRVPGYRVEARRCRHGLRGVVGTGATGRGPGRRGRPHPEPAGRLHRDAVLGPDGRTRRQRGAAAPRRDRVSWGNALKHLSRFVRGRRVGGGTDEIRKDQIADALTGGGLSEG